MGQYWLDGRLAGYPSLVDVAQGAGLSVQTWDGWRNRSRSSGGFQQVLGIVVHHTASPSTTTFQRDWSYCAVGHPASPVANMLLGRNGQLGIHAVGAANHAGLGGPWTASKGIIPKDSANAFCVGIEAENNGTGEFWEPVMMDAYERLVAALCVAYRLDPLRDVIAHREWAPSRKIDPWGGNRPTPGYDYTGPRMWVMRGGNGFCDAVKRRAAPTPLPPPTGGGGGDMTDEDLYTLVHPGLLHR